MSSVDTSDPLAVLLAHLKNAPAKPKRTPKPKPKPACDDTTAAIFDTIANAIRRGRERADCHSVRQVSVAQIAGMHHVRVLLIPAVNPAPLRIVLQDDRLIASFDQASIRRAILVNVSLVEQDCFEQLAKRLALVGVPFELEAAR